MAQGFVGRFFGVACIVALATVLLFAPSAFPGEKDSGGGKRGAEGDVLSWLPALRPPLSDVATSREAIPCRDCTEDSLKLH